jgi:hypothetical protein
MEKRAVVAYFNAIFWKLMDDTGKKHDGVIREAGALGRVRARYIPEILQIISIHITRSVRQEQYDQAVLQKMRTLVKYKK